MYNQTGILGSIKEKTVTEPAIPPSSSNINQTPEKNNIGFPKPIHRSLFKQRLHNKNKNTVKETLNSTTTNVDFTSNKKNNDTKLFEKDYFEIDNENNKTIANMSEDEILETIEMLKKTLRPGFIEKITNKKPLLERIPLEENYQHQNQHNDNNNEDENYEKSYQLDLAVAEDLKKREKHVHFAESIENIKESKSSVLIKQEDIGDDDSTPIKMKEKFFSDVSFESEKLEWMGGGTAPYIPTKNDPHAAFFRFDFSGNIIEKNIEVPTYMGLHHHGDEPDRAGYTISELLHLTRSVVPSQKIIPLNIIGRIMRKVRKGLYGFENSKGIADWVIKMKMPVYLRVALDDKAEAVIVAAIDTISAWVIGSIKDHYEEEENLWYCFGNLYRGYESCSFLENKITQTSKEFGYEITLQQDDDDELNNNGSDGNNMFDNHVNLAKKDLVSGLISMNILQRLKYLLDVFNLPQITNDQILLMLVCFARHSRITANAIYKSPELVDVIHRKFICLSWPVVVNDGDSPSSDHKNLPNLSAFKLLRALCVSSIEISRNIKEKYVGTLLRYMLIDPSTLSNQFEIIIGYDIFYEVLRIYHTLVAYGLYHEIFSQLYTVFSGHLMKEFNIATAFFRLLEVWMRNHGQHHYHEHQTGAQPSEFVKDATDFVESLITSFPLISSSSSTDGNHCEIFSEHKLDSAHMEKTLILLSSIVSYIASWCKYLCRYKLKDTSEIKRIWEKLRLFCFTSTNINKYLNQKLKFSIKEFQNITTSDKDDKHDKWQISNLPGIYYPTTFDYSTKLLKISIFLDLYLSFVSLINYSTRLFKEDKGDFTNVALHRMNTYLQYEWSCSIDFLLDCPQNTVASNLKYQHSIKSLQVKLILIADILPGDEMLALDTHRKIMEVIIKNSSDSGETGKIVKFLDSFYRDRIVSKLLKKNKEFQKDGDEQEEESLLIDVINEKGSLPLLQSYLFSPIDILYFKSSDLVLDQEVKNEIVKGCLKLTCQIRDIFSGNSLPIKNYIIEPHFLALSLMKIFLLEDEIYRDPSVEVLIEELLEKFTLKKRIENISNDDIGSSGSSSNDSNLLTTFYQTLEQIEIKSLLKSTFYQFYQDFIDNYVSESFGNKYYTQLLLLPISSKYSTNFKLLFWNKNELLEIFSQPLKIKYDELVCIDDGDFIKCFLSYFYPIEENLVIMTAFVKALIYIGAKKKDYCNSSILYWMIIHHLNGSIFEQNVIINNNEEDQGGDWINYSSKDFFSIKDSIGKKPNHYKISPLNFFNQTTNEEANKRIELLKLESDP
ncbi:11216_t:CDS:2 [Entrophospora sp. SA101]|nr:11216_t:CDS:2 [Entrophospora sp. SA101]